MVHWVVTPAATSEQTQYDFPYPHGRKLSSDLHTEAVAGKHVHVHACAPVHVHIQTQEHRHTDRKTQTQRHMGNRQTDMNTVIQF